MMKIGLIGSASFHNTYQQELSKHTQLFVPATCSLEDALQERPVFAEMITHCDFLFFEYVDAASYRLLIAALKNGKHILIEQIHISADEMHELYNIANEGNLKCLIFPSADYYHLFEPLQKQIQNPFLVELSLHLPSEQQDRLSDQMTETMNLCVQNLRSIFKSDIRQINVRPLKIFAEKTDLLVVQLDFSSGCNVQFKLSAYNSHLSHHIRVFQQAAIFDINLVEGSVDMTTVNNGIIHINRTVSSEKNITEKKVMHFLAFANDNKNHSSSALDNYLVLDLSAKILKKINSFYE